MKKRRSARACRPRGRAACAALSSYHATVVGLGSIGRLVAVQLAALDVARLQLVADTRVSRRTQAVDGYAHDDIGRRAIHAAAQQCHQVNPLLDVQTVQTRSVSRLDLGDAVFCCGISKSLLQSVWKTACARSLFFAGVNVVGTRIDVFTINTTPTDASSQQIERLSRPKLAQDRQRGLCTVPVAHIGAGLVIAEFVRFVLSTGKVSSNLRLDLGNLTLSRQGRAQHT